jgi:hypothetical protein
MALGEALEASASSVEERVPLLLESAFFLTVMLILVAKF